MNKKDLTGILGFLALLLLTSVAWAAPVPATGQTKCYDVAGKVITCPLPGQPLYGQDANFSINPMSYTKLDDKGVALSDDTTSWAMVRDNVTGLIWENKTVDGTIHDKYNQYSWYDSNPDTNGGVAGTLGNGTNTEDFINALNSDSFGGYNDWRLPTIKELYAIVNYGIPDPGPTINTAFFPNTQSSYYWSSTSYACDIGSAWGVTFYYGYDEHIPKLNKLYARAVRGGKSQPSYVNNDNGTVTDTSTDLMWQQDTPDYTMTWEDALSYCENSNIAYYTDWRLPSKKELISLVDYSRCNPAIDISYFPDTFTPFYWSSTSTAYATGAAWVERFYEGYDFSSYKDNSKNYVRAVRGGQSGPQARCQNVSVTTGPICSATASIDNGSFDPGDNSFTVAQSPSGPYPLGGTPVTLTVTNSKGASSQCMGTVTVVDSNLPNIRDISVDPSSIWPPNGKMVTVTLNYSVTDNCNQLACQISSVTSNEPISSSDYVIVDAYHVKLRADRLGNGNGRIYTISITCKDASGNSSKQAVTVTVPRHKLRINRHKLSD
jgi:hypothetical protein